MIGSLALLPLAAAAGATPPAGAGQCAKANKDEIVVCGSRTGESPYRLPKVSEKYERKPLRAETDAIPGVHTRAHAESEARADGNVDKRLMVTFSIPF
jgi:hypothetical protein